MTETPNDAATNPQQTIAELQRKLAERTAERDDALERQTATADILKVIASSPSDVRPVFEAIASSANRLIGGLSTAVYSLIDDMQHLSAFTPINPAADAALQALYPRPLSMQPWPEQTRNGEIVHVPDIEANSAVPEKWLDVWRMRGFRGFVRVPLRRDRVTVGMISVTRAEPGPFAAHHIQLLQTFADQAIIAIENARLFNEVQAKTRDLTESLQFQTATSDVLKVISRSPNALQPVLDVIADISRKLCGSDGVTIFLLRDQKFHFTAVSGAVPKHLEYLRAHPAPIDEPGSAFSQLMLKKHTLHYPNVMDAPELYSTRSSLGGPRALLMVPLMRDGDIIGIIALRQSHLRPFTPRQIQAIETFADQAVIAISNVDLFEQVQQRTRDLTESLQQQTATADVLKVISRSTFDLQTVLQTLVESAARLCEADKATITRQKDGVFYRAENFGFSREFMDYARNIPVEPEQGSAHGRALLQGLAVHIPDVKADPNYTFTEGQRLGDFRTILAVPMLREGAPIGVLALTRSVVRPFTGKQIELVTTFADQAAIAIGNVRLFEEVQAKTRDLSEALTYQTGSSNILKVIASSPTNVEPVLKAIVESACELCEAIDAVVHLRDGDDLRHRAHHGPIPFRFERLPINRDWVTGRAFVDKAPIHLHDVASAEGAEFPEAQRLSRLQGTRSILAVPLLRENVSIGAIALRRTEVKPFNDKQIAMLQTFADQAVIAIGNVRLFEEVQARTEDLRESLQFQTATSDVLKVISRSPDALQPVLDVIVETSRELCKSDASTIFLLRDRKFHMAAISGVLPAHVEQLKANPQTLDQPGTLLARSAREKRTLNFGNVLDDPELKDGLAGRGGPRALLAAPLISDGQVIGVIVLRQSHLKPFTPRQIQAIETFADQAVIAISNVNLFEQVQHRTRELSNSLDDLRTAQGRLIQTEKLASLGQLTAGIAHEIKNPLNFVNNFSALSAELIEEMKDMLSDVSLDKNKREDLDEITQMLKSNLDKVVQHGKRADSIVKNMLLHSRQGSGEHRPVDINAIVDESLNLAYHGARAENTGFNITMHRSFDPAVGMADGYPQEVTRALLNLISNGFYAATKRKSDAGDDFEPTMTATTKNLGDKVEIRIRDNGTGIPTEVIEKIFNPFFTTKPAGEGTGLGLSMSHDIIVKQHGGTIDVDTAPGAFTEFRIVLPRVGASLIKSGEQR